MNDIKIIAFLLLFGIIFTSSMLSGLHTGKYSVHEFLTDILSGIILSGAVIGIINWVVFS